MNAREAGRLLAQASQIDRFVVPTPERAVMVAKILAVYTLEEAEAALVEVLGRTGQFEIDKLRQVMNAERHRVARAKPGYLSIPGHYGPGGPDGDLLRQFPDQMPEIES